MPTNLYNCKKHGDREITYVGDPPLRCGVDGCRCALKWIPSRFGVGGDLGWFYKMSEKDLDKIEIQLGERPTSPDHLRRIEKRVGVARNFGHVTPISQLPEDRQEKLRKASKFNYLGKGAF